MRLPALGIIALYIFSILIDIYITLDVKSVSKKRIWPIVYLITSILFWAFLTVIISLPRRDGGSDILPVMWMLYAYLSVYLAKFVYAISSILGKLLRYSFGIFPYSHPFKWFGILSGLSLCGVMWIGAFYTTRHIDINQVEIKSNKLPKAFDGYRIAQISDLHVGTWGEDTSFVSALVDSVNSLRPDLIVFTGDIVNRHTRELYPFIPILKRLKATDGVYSIFGNHDYGDYLEWANKEDKEENNLLLARNQQKMGWKLLNNDKSFLKKDNDSIILIGVENWGDPPFPTYGDLDIAIPSSPDSTVHQNDENFKILLSHNPEHWNQEVSKKTNIDLTLSGHTHAMQVLLKIKDWKWSPSKYRYEQWGGLYERENHKGENTQLYVNIGAGEVGMPARLLNAYPEITIFTLRSK